MRTEISIGDKAASGLSAKVISSQIPAIVFALAVSAGAIYAAANGPAVYSTGQRFRAEQIQEEDRKFCEKFQMPPDSGSFPTCVAYLSEIRRLHGERVLAEAAGMP